MILMNDDYPNFNYYLVAILIILLESDINNYHHTIHKHGSHRGRHSLIVIVIGTCHVTAASSISIRSVAIGTFSVRPIQ